MDLKSGDLYWPTQTKQAVVPASLEADAACEVAIIGAGLSGALIANSLFQKGIDTVLLDKRSVGTGSTSASTALIQYEIDVPLFELIRMRGETDAARCYQLTHAAIGDIEQLVGTWKDNCGFVRRPSLFLARRKPDILKLKQEFMVRKRFNFKVEYLPRSQVEKLFPFSAPAALLSADAAEINPFAFTRSLLQSVQEHGARVYAPVTVRRVITSFTRMILETDTGHRIAAEKIIVAAGYESMKFFRRKLVQLRSTYALVTQPVPDFEGWHQRCLIWESGRPYCYLRTTLDQRLMIGGGDEDFVDPEKRDALIPAKTRALKKKLEKMFPDIEIKPAFAWAGTFGDTKDGLPYIGSLPSSPNILFALCYGANGTNFAAIAAKLATDWVKETPNPDARLFALDRQIRP